MGILLKSSLAAMGALALVGPAIAQGDNERNGGRKVAATLTGGAEVPGPGDPNGAGLFEARINPGTERICYTLSASNIDQASAAHIHVGGSSVAGDVVLTLDTPDGDDDDSEDCQDIDRGLAQEIIRNPSNYYVNVHNAAFPSGAIRGQLMKG